MGFNFDKIIYGYTEKKHYYFRRDYKRCATLLMEKSCYPVAPRVTIFYPGLSYTLYKYSMKKYSTDVSF